MIDAIRPVAPTRLFVACDGPNPEHPGEAEKVAATRAVIEHEIDWPCQIERLYSDVNQGCRLGVSRAINGSQSAQPLLGLPPPALAILMAYRVGLALRLAC